MLDALEITGYQSLDKVRIELGGLTVITGSSNSGKTALIRALVMLAKNAPGTGYVTTGRAACTVATGSEEEGFVVRLTRTTKRGGGEYRLKVAGVPAAKVFTKLARGVPDEVSAVLRIGPLNVARQFDPPYLLDSAGREVAAVLGRLTNVSMVLAAAAEAGRRRKQLARDLRGAEDRLAGLYAEAEKYEGLPARRKAIARAEEALAALEEASGRLERLRLLCRRSGDAAQAVAGARAVVTAAEPPSPDVLEDVLGRLGRLRALAAEHAAAGAERAAWERALHAASGRESSAHEALHEALVAAGQCPTCGQAVA